LRHPRTGVLTAAFRCATPARGGAFVDERCVVAGEARPRADAERSGSPRAAPPTLRAPVDRVAGLVKVRVSTRGATLHTGVLITTFDRAAPARGGAFAGEPVRRRVRRRRPGADGGALIQARGQRGSIDRRGQRNAICLSRREMPRVAHSAPL